MYWLIDILVILMPISILISSEILHYLSVQTVTRCLLVWKSSGGWLSSLVWGDLCSGEVWKNVSVQRFMLLQSSMENSFVSCNQIHQKNKKQNIYSLFVCVSVCPFITDVDRSSTVCCGCGSFLLLTLTGFQCALWRLVWGQREDSSPTSHFPSPPTPQTSTTTADQLKL